MEQWRYFNNLIAQIEGQYFSVPLVVFTLIAAGGAFASSAGPAVLAPLACLALAVIAAVSACLTFRLYRVAVIRGYLQRIEGELNESLGAEAFLWSVDRAPEHLGRTWMNVLVMTGLALAFAVVCVSAVVAAFAAGGPLWLLCLEAALLVSCAVMVALSILALRLNDRVSEAVRKGDGSFSPFHSRRT